MTTSWIDGLPRPLRVVVVFVTLAGAIGLLAVLASLGR